MMMKGLFDLSGKVAVVTGSSRGLGYAIAEAMIAHGATVIVSSESAQDTAAAAAALNATGVPCDVADDAAIAALVAKANERFGGIDILVSNAGINGGQSTDPLDMGSYGVGSTWGFSSASSRSTCARWWC